MLNAGCFCLQQLYHNCTTSGLGCKKLSQQMCFGTQRRLQQPWAKTAWAYKYLSMLQKAATALGKNSL
jgi:hypothetical protein